MMRFEAPDEREARDRAWRVVRAAYETREPVTWPRRHARPLAAGALVAAVVAAAISPPGRSVIHSLRKAVGVQHAAPELFSLPTSGRLLVSGPGGTWVVNRDGSRRRLGHYRDAAWSPHGLYLAATRANELVALDPNSGNVRWSLPRRSPRFPVWTGTRTDTRIAYLSGGRLRVVGGDSTGDRRIGFAARVAPAWRPGPGRVLAYASTPRAVRVYDVDTGAVLRRFSSVEAVRKLQWSEDGRLLLVFTPHATRVYDGRGRVVAQDSLSDATFDVDAAFLPGTHRVTAIRAEGSGSAVLQLRPRRTLFRGTGIFRQLTWSPDGRWLLVSWPTANQWVFVRSGPRKIVGASRISTQFGGFPRVSGWCCGSR
jgi:WD40 repeat protein